MKQKLIGYIFVSFVMAIGCINHFIFLYFKVLKRRYNIVTKCIPKPTTAAEAIILEVVISDPDMNATYHRDFKIVPIGKAYQIDDVVEYD